jgi:type IV pilus assembly protein PilW
MTQPKKQEYKKMIQNNKKGMTLVELLVVLVITLLVTGAMYAAYRGQQKSYFAQEQVARMQQTLRTAEILMTREIRMAGYGYSTVTLTASANTTIQSANATAIRFTMDLDGNGDTNGSDEDVTYTHVGQQLMRDTGGGNQAIAQNIDAFEFQYAVDANPPDGAIDTNATGAIVWTTVPANPNRVRAVRFWILAMSDADDPDYTNPNTYYVAGNCYKCNPDANCTNAINCQRRYRLLESAVRARNQGLP